MSEKNLRQYWRDNLRYLLILLSIWFLVSYVCGIFLVDTLNQYSIGGAKLGLIIGLLTTAATLFSTFTLQGMPDFFRNHGIGSWIFLAVSDGGLIFCMIWFAYHLRKKAALKGYQGMGGLMRSCYEHPLAGLVYFAGVCIFLVPYVASGLGAR